MDPSQSVQRKSDSIPDRLVAPPLLMRDADAATRPSRVRSIDVSTFLVNDSLDALNDRLARKAPAARSR